FWRINAFIFTPARITEHLSAQSIPTTILSFSTGSIRANRRRRSQRAGARAAARRRSARARSAHHEPVLLDQAQERVAAREAQSLRSALDRAVVSIERRLDHCRCQLALGWLARRLLELSIDAAFRRVARSFRGRAWRRQLVPGAL